jgi:hypothetical protein
MATKTEKQEQFRQFQKDQRKKRLDYEKANWNEFDLSEKELLEKLSYDQRRLLNSINDKVAVIRSIIVILFLLQIIAVFALIAMN